MQPVNNGRYAPRLSILWHEQTGHEQGGKPSADYAHCFLACFYAISLECSHFCSDTACGKGIAGHTHTHTQTKYCNPLVHACRGLITYVLVCKLANVIVDLVWYKVPM